MRGVLAFVSRALIRRTRSKMGPLTRRSRSKVQSRLRRLVQSHAHRSGDPGRVDAADGAGQAMQRIEHPAQRGEQATALRALLHMPFDSRALARGKLAVEIVRHMRWGPAVIAADPEAMEEVAHLS